MISSKKALVLSGGGARGAYHIGVIETLVQHGWMVDGTGPDIIAGTSIGAINAAALASGLTVDQLKQHWLAMHTEDVHRLSRDLPSVARPLLRFLMHNVLTSEAHNGVNDMPDMTEGMSTQSVFSRLGALFKARPFRSLLDTTPWRYTLEKWMDFDRINSSTAPALLLAATDLQSGALRMFCNRDRKDHASDMITIDHLMASSSIPIVYPWTTIEEHKYWDGAVLANTPLGPVVDVAGDSDVDIIVVMMTPWNEDPAALRAQLQHLPEDLVQALSLTLDWSLLASYRAALKMLRSYNRLAAAAQELERAAGMTGDDSFRMLNVPRRVAEPIVISPQAMMPLEWMIDYEEATHHHLFELGRADAERALAQRQ
ncbi:MAG: patatin-like phospholipase family protein [Chloroflexi bacterium AL-W]|nr:patatin-like phospholipase family protein [Chloroflexi bacterium AL-N1]NOK68038.1 patatin-like phospholipase family protein [Chloroflexi bacterium AL-N10]NOK73378.1 patatin-like phospholipase family protein [Chloroflexi bacterium AL-N5]NOK83292.1 patatin-like phospholipase family protein [Chloroflexi bacterium AL-W]NOK87709.1 patatin-like phospholipase family protein [Chloroflexi bacterium AL-N15]